MLPEPSRRRAWPRAEPGARWRYQPKTIRARPGTMSATWIGPMSPAMMQPTMLPPGMDGPTRATVQSSRDSAVSTSRTSAPVSL